MYTPCRLKYIGNIMIRTYKVGESRDDWENVDTKIINCITTIYQNYKRSNGKP